MPRPLYQTLVVMATSEHDFRTMLADVLRSALAEHGAESWLGEPDSHQLNGLVLAYRNGYLDEFIERLRVEVVTRGLEDFAGGQ